MRQDIVYFDELFNIDKSIYDQADIRTREKVISTFNPSARFWVADRFDDHDTYVDHSTYHDNPYLGQEVINALEKRIKTDSNFYNVYVLGKWGSLEGLIFEEGTHWDIIRDDQYPEVYKKRVIGLDFGFSIDPAAVADVRYSNGDIYLNEIKYATGLLNSDIMAVLPTDARIVADSAEPKSIAELESMGVNVYPSVKGPDSIRAGIRLMKEFKIHVTQSSLNLIKELRNYRWDTNRQGEQLTKPLGKMDHLIDASRYAISDMMNGKEIIFI
jgi:phage terminase large subunit